MKDLNIHIQLNIKSYYRNNGCHFSVKKRDVLPMSRIFKFT